MELEEAEQRKVQLSTLPENKIEMILKLLLRIMLFFMLGAWELS